jgi:hypothetical protein
MIILAVALRLQNSFSKTQEINCQKYEDGGGDALPQLQVTVADQKETIRFFHCFKRGVDRVFVDHPRFLAKVLFFLPFFPTYLCGPTESEYLTQECENGEE